MRPIIVRRLARLAPLAVTVVAAASVPAAAHASSGCAGGDSTAPELGASGARVTTLCLINQERLDQGLPRLKAGATLARVAMRHSRDMVAYGYFAHDSRSGAPFSARIAKSGWMRGRIRWGVGENLAWGTGSRATPTSIVAEWMASPPHRKNILTRRFRVVGIGIAGGVPVATQSAGSTYTTDFGT